MILGFIEVMLIKEVCLVSLFHEQNSIAIYALLCLAVFQVAKYFITS